jgi:hypothetical protein
MWQWVIRMAATLVPRAKARAFWGSAGVSITTLSWVSGQTRT